MMTTMEPIADDESSLALSSDGSSFSDDGGQNQEDNNSSDEEEADSEDEVIAKIIKGGDFVPRLEWKYQPQLRLGDQSLAVAIYEMKKQIEALTHLDINNNSTYNHIPEEQIQEIVDKRIGHSETAASVLALKEELATVWTALDSIRSEMNRFRTLLSEPQNNESSSSSSLAPVFESISANQKEISSLRTSVNQAREEVMHYRSENTRGFDTMKATHTTSITKVNRKITRASIGFPNKRGGGRAASVVSGNSRAIEKKNERQIKQSGQMVLAEVVKLEKALRATIESTDAKTRELISNVVMKTEEDNIKTRESFNRVSETLAMLDEDTSVRIDNSKTYLIGKINDQSNRIESIVSTDLATLENHITTLKSESSAANDSIVKTLHEDLTDSMAILKSDLTDLQSSVTTKFMDVSVESDKTQKNFTKIAKDINSLKVVDEELERTLHSTITKVEKAFNQNLKESVESLSTNVATVKNESDAALASTVTVINDALKSVEVSLTNQINMTNDTIENDIRPVMASNALIASEKSAEIEQSVVTTNTRIDTNVSEIASNFEKGVVSHKKLTESVENLHATGENRYINTESRLAEMLKSNEVFSLENSELKSKCLAIETTQKGQVKKLEVLTGSTHDALSQIRTEFKSLVDAESMKTEALYESFLQKQESFSRLMANASVRNLSQSEVTKTMRNIANTLATECLAMERQGTTTTNFTMFNDRSSSVIVKEIQMVAELLDAKVSHDTLKSALVKKNDDEDINKLKELGTKFITSMEKRISEKSSEMHDEIILGRRQEFISAMELLLSKVLESKNKGAGVVVAPPKLQNETHLASGVCGNALSPVKGKMAATNSSSNTIATLRKKGSKRHHGIILNDDIRKNNQSSNSTPTSSITVVPMQQTEEALRALRDTNK